MPACRLVLTMQPPRWPSGTWVMQVAGFSTTPVNFRRSGHRSYDPDLADYRTEHRRKPGDDLWYRTFSRGRWFSSAQV